MARFHLIRLGQKPRRLDADTTSGFIFNPTAGYTPISLNQYVTITRENPLLRLIQGTHSGQNLTVTLLNGNSSQALTVAQVVAGQPAFVAEAAVDVSTGAQWRKLRVQSTTSTTPAITATREGWMFFPPENEMLTYDNDGNLYSDARWTYTWDAENRLKSMEEKVIAGEGPARTRLEFTYDSQHRRVRKVVKRFSSTTNSFVLTKDRRFIYDGWNLVAELDASPLHPGGPATSQEILRSYLWGNDLSGTPQGAGGVGGLLMIQERDLRAKRGGLPPSQVQAPAVYVPIYDFNGNVINYVEINRGEGITHTFDYDAFGRELTQDTLIPSGDTSPPESLPIKFSTKYHDEETGLAYYGYRYYNPEMGRWVNRDPIGEQGGINLYGMVGNDAVNQWDYLGEYSFKNDTPAGHYLPYLYPWLMDPPTKFPDSVWEAVLKSAEVVQYMKSLENMSEFNAMPWASTTIHGLGLDVHLHTQNSQNMNFFQRNHAGVIAGGIDVKIYQNHPIQISCAGKCGCTASSTLYFEISDFYDFGNYSGDENGNWGNTALKWISGALSLGGATGYRITDHRDHEWSYEFKR